MKPKIEKEAYELWAKNYFVEYVTCYVDKNRKRLSFGSFLGGGFKVLLDGKTLYEGGDFASAQTAFNQEAGH